MEYVSILDTRMGLTEIKHLLPNIDHTTILPDFEPYDNITLPNVPNWEHESVIFRFMITELQSGNIPDYEWLFLNLSLNEVAV